MKIIFLDCDGVINNWNWFKDHRDKKVKRFYGENIDFDNLMNVRYIVKETYAKIVLTSTWRKSQKSITALNLAFKKIFLDEIFSITPISESGYRGEEIQQWLNNNKDLNIESFIIIDDDADLDPYKDRWIQTDMNYGLTDYLAWKSISMLKGNIK